MHEDGDGRMKGAAARRPAASGGFVRQVLGFYGIGALFLLALAALWYSAHVLLLLFSCLLMAVLLDSACRAIERRFRLSRVWSLAAVLGGAGAVLGLGGWLVAPQVVEQASELVATLPQAIARLRAYIERYAVLRNLMDYIPAPEQMLSNASDMLAKTGMAFYGVLGALGNVAIILFVGVYLAAQPRVYIDNLIMLLPHHKRQRGREVVREVGETLSQWLSGKLLSMTIVGIATAVGLMLLGVPLALVLGVVAGLLDFIPYIGPILAAVPAVLIAFSQGPSMALYVVVLFFALQLLEGYVLLPLVERKSVALPPALTIAAQVMLGSLFGLAGVALATPLAAVLTVLVVMLYVQDVLGDDVKTPAEHQD